VIIGCSSELIDNYLNHAKNSGDKTFM